MRLRAKPVILARYSVGLSEIGHKLLPRVAQMGMGTLMSVSVSVKIDKQGLFDRKNVGTFNNGLPENGVMLRI